MVTAAISPLAGESVPAQPTGTQVSNIEASSHLEVISRLQAVIEAATASIASGLIGSSCSLLDFPDHPNVGDSAIWMGEIAWLKRTVGTRPAYANDHQAGLDVLEREVPPGPVLLHGGGNFGDLWPEIQRSRVATLRGFGDRTIVQLPQSIHFESPEGIDDVATAIAAVRDFTLLVRDQESLDLARRHFDCPVVLCPDMAFALGPIERPGAPTSDVLLLLRTDLESRGFAAPAQLLPEGWRLADWLDDHPHLYSRTLWTTRRNALMSLDTRRWGRVARRTAYFDNLAEARVARGVSLLGQARFVITDRLHVHILCTLMGIPHCVLDNSYGKIRRFSDAFDTRWRGCFAATSLNEAMEVAHAALER